MKGLLADINIAGQTRALVENFFGSEEWSEFWNALNVPFLVFANVGLAPNTSDDVVWQSCQENELVLITGNRNKDGPTSMEATIRTRLRPDSLPVITVSKPTTLGLNSAYTSQVGIKLLELLYDIEHYRGTGRTCPFPPSPFFRMVMGGVEIGGIDGLFRVGRPARCGRFGGGVGSSA